VAVERVAAFVLTRSGWRRLIDPARGRGKAPRRLIAHAFAPFVEDALTLERFAPAGDDP
jgi:hypothetical protein